MKRKGNEVNKSGLDTDAKKSKKANDSSVTKESIIRDIVEPIQLSAPEGKKYVKIISWNGM
jgi:hypothetical protein